MRGALTVAHLTLADARRKRIVTAAVLCAAVFLAVFGTGVFFAAREIRSSGGSFVERQITLTILTIAGLFAGHFLAVLFAVLLPIDALSGEIDSGVMQTLASKPISRGEIVVGKWLGHSVLVLGYLGVVTAGVLLSVRLLAAYAPINLSRALPLVGLEVVLLTTVSIAGGTRLSTVTNGVMCLGFYSVGFIGGWIEQIGTLAGIESARTIGIAASLVSPSDAMWRLAAYHLQPAIVRNIPTPFTGGIVPTPLMVWWAGVFTVLTLVWGVRSFQRRAL
jgi:ABC-type transport system involved in multi-copper enzyme maturation permease subunit